MNNQPENYKVLWLSANKLGYELLKESLDLGIKIDSIMTLDEDAKTVMYDGISIDKWKEIGHKYSIKTYAVKNINENIETLISINPDLIVMCGWRQMLDQKILDLPKDGVIGFHPTLLPKGRGPAPIINSILDKNFTDTGLTMFYAAEGVDNGDIIGQESFFMDKETDYAEEVYKKVIDAGRILIKNYLPSVINKTAPRMRQDNSESSYFDKRTLKDNLIDISKDDFDDASRKVRALSKPYAGAYIVDNGKEIRIWDVKTLKKYYDDYSSE